MNDKIKERFEANMLDGDPIENCGSCVISAKAAFEYLQEEVALMLSKREKEILDLIDTFRGEKERDLSSEALADVYADKLEALDYGRVSTANAIYSLITDKK